MLKCRSQTDSHPMIVFGQRIELALTATNNINHRIEMCNWRCLRNVQQIFCIDFFSTSFDWSPLRFVLFFTKSSSVKFLSFSPFFMNEMMEKQKLDRNGNWQMPVWHKPRRLVLMKLFIRRKFTSCLTWMCVRWNTRYKSIIHFLFSNNITWIRAMIFTEFVTCMDGIDVELTVISTSTFLRNNWQL